MALYKRPNSKYWWFKFHFDGELVQRSSQCANKRDASTVESAYRMQLTLGKIGIKPKVKAPTFKKALEDYLTHSKIEHAAKPNTHARNIYLCKPLKLFFAEKKVDRIEPGDVTKYVVWRSRQISRKTKMPVTHDTINLELIALKTIFKRLVSDKTLSDSPAKDIKQLSRNDRQFHVITDEEEKIYLPACPQPLQDVATLMLETGMRPSEIYNLRRKSVNVETGFLQVRNGKTEASNRKVWLSDKAAAVLQNRIKNSAGEFLFPKNNADIEAPLLEINKLHRKTVDRTVLKFRLYDCRHTFATRVLESGIDLLTLASMLGHSSLNQVMRYAHPSENRKNEAIQEMQKRKAKAV